MYSEKLSLGFSSRSDTVITSMLAKAEGNKTKTSIKPGDLLTLDDQGTVSTITEDTANSTCCIYGIACIGIHDLIVPVATKGHIIANLDTSIFTGITVGKDLKCTKGDQKCSSCNIFVVQKLKTLKANGSLQDGYELLLR